MFTVSDKGSPVFTTMNPIMCNVESDSDTSQFMFRGRGDGEGGFDDDDDSGVKTTHDDSDIVQHEPDSDFDDFDSNDEEDNSLEGETESAEPAGSQDNEIQEIYFVQDSKQTRVLGNYCAVVL